MKDEQEKHMVHRYQATFVMGTGEKGAAVAQILKKQAVRIAKMLNKEKPSEMATLRVALRTLATLKDKDIVLDGED